MWFASSSDDPVLVVGEGGVEDRAVFCGNVPFGDVFGHRQPLVELGRVAERDRRSQQDRVGAAGQQCEVKRTASGAGDLTSLVDEFLSDLGHDRAAIRASTATAAR